MIVNVDDVFFNKPKMKSWLYFTLMSLAFITCAYRTGAQSPSMVAEALWIISLTLAISYPAALYIAFKSRQKVAIHNYQRHLGTLDFPALKELHQHPDLSSFSRPILTDYLKRHYPHDFNDDTLAK